MSNGSSGSPTSGARRSGRWITRSRTRPRCGRSERALEPGERFRIRLAAEVAPQALAEQRIVRRGPREQRQRRTELAVIRLAEDIARGTAVDRQKRRRALPQPRTEPGMRQG